MNGNLKFSIICPAYNSSKFIEEAILSILNQDYFNWELIIVDNYSCDSTREIVLSHSDSDKRVIFHQTKSNIFEAREIGVSLASGEVIMFLDSDDMYKHNALSTIASIFERDKDIDVVFWAFTAIRNDGNFDRENNYVSHVSSDFYSLFTETINGGLWNKAVRKKCFKTSVVPSSVKMLKVAEDMAFAATFLINCKKAFISNLCLYYYRVIPIEEKTRNISSQLENDFDKTFIFYPFVFETLMNSGKMSDSLERYIKNLYVCSFFSFIRNIFKKDIATSFWYKKMVYVNYFSFINNCKTSLNFKQKIVVFLLKCKCFLPIKLFLMFS